MDGQDGRDFIDAWGWRVGAEAGCNAGEIATARASRNDNLLDCEYLPGTSLVAFRGDPGFRLKAGMTAQKFRAPIAPKARSTHRLQTVAH